MSYKLLSADIDGTLVNSNKIITEKTKTALIEVQKKGIKLVIATGRPLKGMVKYAEELQMKKYGGYIIAYNGCELINAANGEILLEERYNERYARLLYDFSRKHNTGIMTYDGDVVITEDIEDEYILLEAKLNGLSVKKVDSFKNHVNYPVYKCILTSDGSHLAEVEKKLRSEVSDCLNPFRSEPFFLEVLPKNVDKSSALRYLTEYLGFTRDEVIGFGDGYNDITMIEYAGLGVAMENAQEILKNKADFVTLSNNNDGIAEVIKNLNIII